MDLRRYRTEDLPALSRLFGETVRRVNIRDYTPAQVEAWAAGEADLLTRDDWFRRLYTLVAEIDGRIAGYGNVDGTGYLDHLSGGTARAGASPRSSATRWRNTAGTWGWLPSPSTPPRPRCRFSSTGTTRWSGSSRCRFGGRCWQIMRCTRNCADRRCEKN